MATTPPFLDRREAGRALGALLGSFSFEGGVIVLALPRGGVPVAYEIAQALHAPLDVITVRKLGTPGQRELAMGAIASGGVSVLNSDIVEALGISQGEIAKVYEREYAELQRRESAYRGCLPPPQLTGKIVILVDDGLATGATMKAAIKSVERAAPSKIFVAVPVASADTCSEIEESLVNGGCVTLRTPDPFGSVGRWYENFDQVSDSDVISLLEEHRARSPLAS